MKQLVGRLNPYVRFWGQRVSLDNPFRKWASKAWKAFLLATQTDVQVQLHNEPTWVLPQWRSLDPNYEAETVASFAEATKPGYIVWDVGAHVGIFSLIAARRVGVSGRVVAWEPSPEAFMHLKYHLQANGLAERTHCVQEAVHDGRTHEVVFRVDGTSFHNHIRFSGPKMPYREISVRCRSLDSWAESQGQPPDIIKMDIEGSEVSALKGATRLLKGDFGKRPRVLLSVHPASIHYYGETCGKLAELVKEAKYEVSKIHPGSGTLFDFGEVWLNPV